MIRALSGDIPFAKLGNSVSTKSDILFQMTMQKQNISTTFQTTAEKNKDSTSHLGMKANVEMQTVAP